MFGCSGHQQSDGSVTPVPGFTRSGEKLTVRAGYDQHIAAARGDKDQDE